MARTSPHPLALFSLIAKNPRAEKVVLHVENKHLLLTLPGGTLALDIGFHTISRSCTLATLGRGFGTDVYIEGTAIATVQCSFEIDFNTGVVMLCDRSWEQRTQVSGPNCYPFEHGRNPRQVIVQRSVNTLLSMGGQRRNLVQFELKWHQDLAETVAKARYYESQPIRPVVTSRRARTDDADDADEEEPSELSSERSSRMHTPGGQLRMRYVTIGDSLGEGTYGVVHKAVDVDRGRMMAVKILRQPGGVSTKEKERRWKKAMKYAEREINALIAVDHPHIVDYIASQGGDIIETIPQLLMVPVEIFMGLKEGTLHDLVDNRIKFPVELVLPQMLKALDFVASKGIVHRDLKPSNILYVSPNGQYTFQLGDFGLCNDTTATSTGIGTNIYMAPEINVAGVCQTKADVWSLFVTMLWVSDPNFRERSHDLNPAELQQTILDAAQEMGGVVSTMAIKDPEQRASAAYILLSMYDGDGLTTPRHRIRHANIPAAKATTETSSAWPPSRPTPYFT